MAAAFFTPERVVTVFALASMLALSSDLLVAERDQRSAIPAKADARTVAHVLDRLGCGARAGDRPGGIHRAATVSGAYRGRCADLAPERVPHAHDERVAALERIL